MSLDPLRRLCAAMARSIASLSRRAWPWLRAAWVACRNLARRVAPASSLRAVAARTWLALQKLGTGVASALAIVITTSLIVALALGPWYLFSNRVPAGVIGVKQSQWGGGGVVARDFGPGIWSSLRGWHTWSHLDGRTQFLSFGYASDGGEHKIVDLRTRDGNVVKVSVTVPYRIRDGEAHLLVSEGLKTAYKDMVRTATRNLLGQELAVLSSTDLASTDRRRERMEAALPRLNARLRSLHVVAETIQIQQVFFWMSYESKLQAKQLTRQNALLAEALTLVEEEKRADLIAEEIVAEEQRIRAEMNKQIEQRKADAHRRIAEIKREAQTENVLRRADADAFYQRELAGGKLALDTAEALRDELTQVALATRGGQLLLAREAASKLRIKSVTLDSNDPDVPSVLDLDELVDLLVGRTTAIP